jgi:Zn-dependent protease
MGILGWSWANNPILPGGGLGDVALWVFCCFVSVLLHELGHVWMGQLFGSHGHILLHSMGGLAFGASALESRWQRILVFAAGPGIQLLLTGILLGLIAAGVIPVRFILWRFPVPLLLVTTSWELMLEMLLIINILWPLLNLLPIWPLDGGQITRDVCQAVSRRGLVVSLWISLLVSAAMAVYSAAMMSPAAREKIVSLLGSPALVFRGSLFMALFFALFAIGSWQALQAETARARNYWDDDDLPPWRR